MSRIPSRDSLPPSRASIPNGANRFLVDCFLSYGPFYRHYVEFCFYMAPFPFFMARCTSPSRVLLLDGSFPVPHGAFYVITSSSVEKWRVSPFFTARFYPLPASTPDLHVLLVKRAYH